MHIFEEIQNKYKTEPMYGIQWSIDSDRDAYECDEEITFGDSTSYMGGGMLHNNQDIIYQGEVVGFLHERRNGRIFDPMVISFMCVSTNDDDKQSQHYCEYEDDLMSFAKLQQFINYIKNKI